MRQIKDDIMNLPTEAFEAEIERVLGPLSDRNADRYLDAQRRYNERWEEMHRELIALQAKGTEAEARGETDDAIRAYRECVKVGEEYPRFTVFQYLHSLDRLMALYRKKKDFDSEIKVIEKVLSWRGRLAPKQVQQYVERLEKVRCLQSQ